MSVSVGDFVRITAKMKLFGTDDVMNVYTFRVDRNDTGDDDTFMVAMALHMDDAYNEIVNDLSDQLSFETVDGQNISKSELLPEKAWPVLTVGDSATFLLPTQVAAEVYWPTITPKVRTSSFIGGYTVTFNNISGEIIPAAIARLVLFGAAMKDIATANVDAVKGSWNPTKMIFTESGDPVVPSRWRTQRRRRIGVGS